jgi:hypothetical protein
MATLIAVYNSDGCVGRCDAKCYEAFTSECDCVCGGLNHGAGLFKAADNTRDLADSWIKEYAKAKGITDVYGMVNRDMVDQFSLFDLSCFAESVL